MRFKNWIEDYGADKEQQISDLWDNVFKALLMGGAKPDEVQRTLQDVTGGSPDGVAATITNRLATVLPRFKELDPQLGQQVDQAMSWVGQSETSDHGPHQPQKKVEDLLKLMFGEERFHQLLNRDDHSSDSGDDVGLTQMEPAQQTPADGAPAPTPPDPAAAQIQPGLPNQQPQVPPSPPMMQPSNPPQMAWKQWKGKRLQETS